MTAGASTDSVEAELTRLQADIGRRGRSFTADDRSGAPFVAMVNETFARRYLGIEDAIGRQVRFGAGDRVLEIVGVVADVPPFSPGAPAEPEVCWPYAQSPRSASFFVVRSRLDSSALMKAIEARLATVDPNPPISNVATMEDRVSRQREIGVRMAVGAPRIER